MAPNRSNRRNGGTANQTARCSTSIKANEPDQPQANTLSIDKRLLILAKPWGEGYEQGMRIKADK